MLTFVERARRRGASADVKYHFSVSYHLSVSYHGTTNLATSYPHPPAPPPPLPRSRAHHVSQVALWRRGRAGAV